MEIIAARRQSIDRINEIIKASKEHWNYSESYLAKAVPLLMIDEDYLAENLCFEILSDEFTVGFFAFAMKNGEQRHLDHLWILPEKIGSGFGRLACAHLDQLAREYGWENVFTYPDPPAEGFYLKQGFKDTGERIPSRVDGGPVFSVFVKLYLGKKAVFKSWKYS